MLTKKMFLFTPENFPKNWEWSLKILQGRTVSVVMSPPKITKAQFLEKCYFEIPYFILLFARLPDDVTKRPEVYQMYFLGGLRI